MFKFHADFGHQLLVGRAPRAKWDNLKNAEIYCHNFSISNSDNSNKPSGSQVGMIAGKISVKEILSGPASDLSTKAIVYPCSKHQCVIPCPCHICCRKLPICQNSGQCSCSACLDNFKDHMQYHLHLHLDCKYCNNLINSFPRFNFYFVKTENTDDERFISRRTQYSEKVENSEEIKNIKQRTEGMKHLIKTETFCELRCDECNRNYKPDINNEKFLIGGTNGVRSIEYFKLHVKTHHSMSKKFVHQIRDCMKLKHENNICDHCADTFSSNDKLKRHVSTVHFEQKHPCDICDTIFSRRDKLQRHMKRNHLSEGKIYLCNECDSEFFSNNELKRHIKCVHGDKKVICGKCHKQFSRADHLSRHVKSVHELKVVDISCEVCGKTFTAKDKLNRHIEIVHALKTFSCELCDFNSSRIDSLKRHE